MRQHVLTSVSFFGLATVALLMPLATQGANPRLTVSHRGATPNVEAKRRRAENTVSPCSTDYPKSGDYFVGVNDSPDVAGGDDSAVVSGSNNYVCVGDSAIGSGVQNSIYYNGIYSFIGGGLGNNIVYLASFIGAGNDNQAIGAENDFVGAGNGNTASGASAFVGAGGEKSGGSTASGEDSFVGAGDQNSSNALGGFIGAGYSNTVGATSIYGVVAGGSGNNVGGVNGAIGGGYQNVESANDAVIAGGYQGTLNAEYGAIGGGFQNLVSGEIGTVAGGQSNTASGTESAVGGGVGNIASGQGAVVPGGLKNTAKGYASFAGGAHSLATATGTFVWSDDATNATQVNATTANSFLVRASGGVTFYSSLNLASGVQLNAGSGTWSSLSDRNAKTDVLPVDDESILAKVAALPVSTWRYKTEEGARHVGPMAQDFYAAFGVGEDDRHITSLDEDGVALAAIKALNQKLAQKLADKDREIAGLNDRLTHLEATVVAITRRR